MTLTRGVGLVVLTPEGVRQRSDISHTAFELRSLPGPCLSSEKLSVAVLLFSPSCWGNHCRADLKSDYVFTVSNLVGCL